jgi:site-specific DNA recombinase
MYRTSKPGKKLYRYYRCVGTDAYRFDGQRICDTPGIRTNVLEEAVWQDVCALLREPERVREEYERRLEGAGDTSTATLKQLDSLIQKTGRAIARLIDAYEDGLLSKDEFEPRIHASKQRLAQLQEERSNLTTRESEYRDLRLVIGHLEDFHQRISEGLETIDWMAKREIIRSLVKRVKIDKTNVRVIYKISPPSFGSDNSIHTNLHNCSRQGDRLLGP